MVDTLVVLFLSLEIYFLRSVINSFYIVSFIDGTLTTRFDLSISFRSETSLLSLIFV